MTRKDTILIAVVVNAALLIALFVTAVKRDESPLEKVVTETPIATIAKEPKKEIKVAQGDEIDQVLKEFTEKKVASTSSTPQQTQPLDFAKELEAITKAAPVAPKKTVSPPAAKGIEVTVKKGDALEKIARAHHVSVSEIVEMNNLHSTTLQIGQVLKIPQKEEKKERLTVESKAKYYTVKQGDNPWTIAVKNQIKVEDLLKLNNLNEQKARSLKPGDQLRIE